MVPVALLVIAKEPLPGVAKLAARRLRADPAVGRRARGCGARVQNDDDRAAMVPTAPAASRSWRAPSAGWPERCTDRFRHRAPERSSD